ncbi:glycosyl hydrolase family 18 protein [Prosthecobacter vanneervenii]|uniref:chitinase n=1 Tax=Prosthecobacter vanneervenii TaxID=48466 RepID=A0A7W7YCJ9_9BACT|nr:glycosyl hydrolase family 18 protein [Prosthecobacter vanneervenii]MBB5033360.1 GH18 family chitinase [Prosthecobacter vanneervenii]
MKIPLFICTLLLTAVSLVAQPKVVAYVPNWIDLKTFAPQIDYAKLTHINIAFENPANAEGALSFHAENDQLIRHAREHGVKVLASLGGGSASENKSMRERWFDLISNAKRARFVTRLAEYTGTHDLDGLDIDLEGPAINHDYTAFIQELSAALKQKNKLLTAALSKGYGGKDVPDAALTCFDFINVMAYDATGPWQPKKPGQHSSLEFAQANVDYWLQRGLPKAKLILGVPFYGWGFGKAFRDSEYRYADLVQAYPEAATADQIGDTIWFNGIPTMKTKARLVREQGLGGMMIWSLNSDAAGADSLLSAMHAELQSVK